MMDIQGSCAGDIRASLDLVSDPFQQSMAELNPSAGGMADMYEAQPQAEQSGAEHVLTCMRESVSSLPRDAFVDNIVALSGWRTQDILNAKDNLVSIARQRTDCPISRTITRRKGTHETDELFIRRIAKDCYKLLQFIEGGCVSEIADVFRCVLGADINAEQCDKIENSEANKEHFCGVVTTLDSDIVASLKAAVHNTIERLACVETEMKSLREELSKAKTDHSDKRKEIEHKNRLKEKEIRDIIQHVSDKCKDDVKSVSAECRKVVETSSNAIQKMLRECKTMREDFDNHGVAFSNKVDQVHSRVKELTRDHKDTQLSLRDAKQMLQNMKEPKEMLLTSLKNQVKTLKDRVKGVDDDTQMLSERVSSNTSGITSLREKLVVNNRQSKDSLKDVRQMKAFKEYLMQHKCAISTGGQSQDVDFSLPHPQLGVQRSPPSGIVSRSVHHKATTMTPSVDALSDRTGTSHELDRQDKHTIVDRNKIDSVICHTGFPADVRPKTKAGISKESVDYGISDSFAAAASRAGDHRSAVTTRAKPDDNTSQEDQPWTTQHAGSITSTSATHKGDCASGPEVSHAATSEQFITVVSGRHHRKIVQNSRSASYTGISFEAEVCRNDEKRVPFYIGNVNKLVTDNIIKRYFENEGIKVFFIKVIVTKLQHSGNGVKIVISENDQSKLSGMQLPHDIYIRKWHVRERQTLRYGS
jgi:hypothetical protein